MEPWRANGTVLGLNVILWASKLPFSSKVKVLTADLCTKCVICIAPLLSNEVVSAWKSAREKHGVHLYGAALSATINALVTHLFKKGK
jgi:hypothetical protein